MHVTLSSSTEMTDLPSNHEVVDIKRILHYANALSASKGSAVILCSPSGDTDNNVLATALLKNYMSRLLNMVQEVTKRDVGLKISHLNEADSSCHIKTTQDIPKSYKTYNSKFLKKIPPISIY